MKTDKYCPVGEIECECYGTSRHFCGYMCVTRNRDLNIEGFEQCPWPSRQKPVDAYAKVKEQFIKEQLGKFQKDNGWFNTQKAAEDTAAGVYEKCKKDLINFFAKQHVERIEEWKKQIIKELEPPKRIEKFEEKDFPYYPQAAILRKINEIIDHLFPEEGE